MASRRRITRFLLIGLTATGLLISGIVGWRQLAKRAFERDLKQAIFQAKAGNAPKAIQLFDRVLEYQPTHARALVYRGQLARDSGDSSAALVFLRRVGDESSVEAGIARFIEGTILLEAHRAREAERLLRQSIELYPAYVQPRERLARLYLTQARGQEAREVFEALRKLRPLELEELVAYSDVAVLFHSAAENIPRLEAFVSADSDDLESRIALARYYADEERHEDLLSLLDAALDHWPGEPRLVALKSEFLIARSRFDAAQQLLAAASAHPLIDRSRGLLAEAQGEWQVAAQSLEAAWEQQPDDLAMAYKLGQAWDRLGLHDEARRLLERSRLMEQAALAVFRVRVGDHTRKDLLLPVIKQIAELLEQLDRPHEARLWCQHALALAPEDPQVQRLVTRLRLNVDNETSPPGDGPSASPEQVTVRLLLTDARRHRQQASPALPRPVSRQASAERPAEARSSAIRLVDRHVEAGLNFEYYNGRSEFKYLIETLGGGVAVLDYDADGWPEFYFPQGSDVPGVESTAVYSDRLFRNRGDGTFVDVTAEAGLGDTNYSQGCAAGDFDNDGFADLVVANFGVNVFYRSNGDGTFTDITARAGLSGDHWHSSLAFADLDRDGDLDLYAVTYVLEALKVCRATNGRMSTCSPANFPAEEDLLYLNRGDGTFEDITKSAGILAPGGKGLGIVVADFDNDRWPDIYVANDGTPNFLFKNLGPDDEGRPRFAEIGLASGAAVNADGSAQAGMGVACGDLNDDGLLDLYVTNFLYEWNTLYINDGDLLFHDATRSARLVEPTRLTLGFGTQAIDFDLDGRLDLILTNGHIDDFRFRNEPWKMPPQLFHNRGGLQFDEVSRAVGPFFQEECLGRGLASLDWNRDGKPDVVIVHQDRNVALLENQTESTGHSISLELRGTVSNRDCLGARIRYTCGNVSRIRELTGGDGFFVTNEHRLILGIGDALQIDRLEVLWPSGQSQIWENLAAGSSWRLIEGSPQMVSLAR